MTDWNNCKNILCIRADNMGDLLMSSPAIRALKETFNCKISLLTSAMGNWIASFIKEIDEVIVADLPWVKTKKPVDEKETKDLIEQLTKKNFDGVVIFTVYSQNPLPAAMLTYLAGIPRRLAYCRENPYNLLTDWVVEKEPFSFIKHQVERDLDLVRSINATTQNDKINIEISKSAKESAIRKIKDAGVDLEREWLIIHPGVSETKREYPEENWIGTGKLLRDELDFQLLVTGSSSEKELCTRIRNNIGDNSFALAGLLSIEEFIALISMAPLVISVNTGTVHIAAATQTPVIVLYALTNPQHTPWKVKSSVLFYSVKEGLRSKNQVVIYVTENLMEKNLEPPSPAEIINETKKLLEKVSEIRVAN
ncbi:MAG TPA: glycosyltransferase family 9 protein [Hanamia sp.]|nr:glycosyltransferase family 9 protein [Hanamia sp.]